MPRPHRYFVNMRHHWIERHIKSNSWNGDRLPVGRGRAGISEKCVSSCEKEAAAK